MEYEALLQENERNYLLTQASLFILLPTHVTHVPSSVTVTHSLGQDKILSRSGFMHGRNR
jgi:hypothetical protein